MIAGNHSPVAAGIRCPACGRRSVSAGVCSACGENVSQSPREIVGAAQQVPLSPALSGGTTFLQPRTSAPAPTFRSPTQAAHVAENDGWLGWLRASDVHGRVIIVRQGANEPMDFDPWRWVAIPVWGLILLISPLAVAILVWQSFGFLPALAVAACSLLVLRFMFSDRLLQSWHLTAALNGRHIVETMPVTMLRIRQSDGREVQLRLKGQLPGGTVIEGDRVAASGAWRAGVLRVRRIQCERTGAEIVPRQPCARGLAIAGLCVLLAGGLWLYFAGVPWVVEQASAFRPSLNGILPATQFQSNIQ